MKTISLQSANQVVENVITRITQLSVLSTELNGHCTWEASQVIQLFQELNKNLENCAIEQVEQVEQVEQNVVEQPLKKFTENQKVIIRDLLQNSLESAFDSMSFDESDMADNNLAELEVDYSNDYADIKITYNAYNVNNFISNSIDISEIRDNALDEFFSDLERNYIEDGDSDENEG